MHAWTNKKANFSQGSQDFYFEKIFSVIQTTNKYFVEFGFNEPSYESGGSGANTRKLYQEGWHGLLLDSGNENLKINLKKHYLFASNIAAIFAQNAVPKDLDLLSCDMDSHDLWVFRAILQAGYRPRVITTEYNANYPLTDAITLIDPTIVRNESYFANYKFEGYECAWGAGAGAYRRVAEAHGYTLVGRVEYLDLIWIRNDLVINSCFRIPSFEWFFHDALIGQQFHKAQVSPNVLSKLIDYDTYVRSGENLTASNQAARDILKKRGLACYNSIKQFL